ncbi:DUF1127 domain-containing protein [Algihabitans albus]|uniref:DUF1127 domain-containing protein n=1 Tax=Algihabitans albus TaxID=2164067 RepID=UPI000E5D9642|nr:DUF1127 domain-containing protein [Algihabitans albus]
MIRWPAWLLDSLRFLRRTALTSATAQELRALDPSLLKDIGIGPEQIDAVAAGLVQRGEDQHTAAAQPSSRRADVVVLLPPRRPVPALSACDATCCAA